MQKPELTAQQITNIAELLEKELSGKDFALLVFNRGEDFRDIKYISNARQQEMITAFEALLDKWALATPESN